MVSQAPSKLCYRSNKVYSAIRVAQAMRLYDWDPEEGPWDIALEEVALEWTYPDRPIPICNTIFRHIGFSRTPIPPWYTASTDPHLITYPSTVAIAKDWIAAHPVASRSFATFPTVRQMRIHYHGTTFGSPAQGATGTTVWDVSRSIQHE